MGTETYSLIPLPMSEINKGWQDMIRNMLFASLIILALASIAILRFTSRITKPLRDLTEAARRANRGHSEQRAGYDKNDEVGILKSSLSHLDYKASHDELTGALNRTGYELLLSGIEFGSTCMILLDVDNFKTVNDTYGHEVGDRVLIRLARVLRNSFRSEDYVCRIGGDEFVVLMAHIPEEQHHLIAPKIEEINRELSEPEDGLPPVTISAGIAHGAESSDTTDWFEKADEALYRAKQSGKHTYIFFSR